MLYTFARLDALIFLSLFSQLPSPVKRAVRVIVQSSVEVHTRCRWGLKYVRFVEEEVPACLPSLHKATNETSLEIIWVVVKNVVPFLGILNIRCRTIIRTQKRTIILTSTHLSLSLKRGATRIS